MWQSLPNILTVMRGIMSIPVLWLILYGANNWAAILLAAACITDAVDGYLARKLNLESSFGKIADQIVDKILVISILFILAHTQAISAVHLVPAIIIVYRELIIAGIRDFAHIHQFTLYATSASKLKTGLQMSALWITVLSAQYPALHCVGMSLLWVSSLLAIVSLYNYGCQITTRL